MLELRYCKANCETPMPVKKERCMMGRLEIRLCSIVWTLGRSAGWSAASQSLCCPYFCGGLPPPLVLGACLLFLPLRCPLAGAGRYVGGCGGGPYGYVDCIAGGAGGKVWCEVAGLGYGWYR